METDGNSAVMEMKDEMKYSEGDILIWIYAVTLWSRVGWYGRKCRDLSRLVEG